MNREFFYKKIDLSVGDGGCTTVDKYEIILDNTIVEI
jgi:hypothetical protein